MEDILDKYYPEGWNGNMLEELKALVDVKANEKIYSEESRIMGKSMSEVIAVLSALEIERATDMVVTMKNLRRLYDVMVDEQKEMFKRTMQNTLDNLSKGKS